MEEARAAAAKAAKEANNPALALRKFLKATQPADPTAVKSIKDEEEDTHAAEKAGVPTDGEGYVNVARECACAPSKAWLAASVSLGLARLPLLQAGCDAPRLRLRQAFSRMLCSQNSKR